MRVTSRCAAYLEDERISGGKPALALPWHQHERLFHVLTTTASMAKCELAAALKDERQARSLDWRGGVAKLRTFGHAGGFGLMSAPRAGDARAQQSEADKKHAAPARAR